MTFPPQLLEPLQIPNALPGCLCLTQLILYLQHKNFAGQQHFLCDAPTPFCRAAGAPSAPVSLHISPIPQHRFPGPSEWPLVALSHWQPSVTGSPCATRPHCQQPTHTHRAELTAALTPELQHSPNQTLTLQPTLSCTCRFGISWDQC